jgi:hypothetical protein
VSTHQWTAEQEEFWRLVRGDRPSEPSGDQTPEQAVEFAATSFLGACEFEGVELPPREAVLARLGRYSRSNSDG